MAVVYPDTRFLPVAQQLLACLCDAVALNPKPPAMCCFRPYADGAPLGGVTQDECRCGLAFVRAVDAYPSRDGFPQPQLTPITCGTTWAGTLQMGIWRCAPNGTLQAGPSCAEWNELQVDLLNDYATIRDALCCFISQRQSKTVAVETWSTVSDVPQGGCIGTSVTIVAQLT